MPKTPSINLVKGRSGSYVDRFMSWALSIGRLVVIITETIALATFLTRFSYDRQISDLHSKIKQDQAIVKAYADQEATYRNTQDRLTSIQQLENQAPQLVDLMKGIAITIPSDTTLSDLTVTPDSLKVEAIFQSTTSLATLIKSLQDNPKITSVSLDKIEDKTTSAVIVANILAKFKK